MNPEETFIQKLKKAGVISAARELGLEDGIFSNEAMDAAYCNHKWIVMNTSVVGYVINAIPKIDLCDRVPWEEWFRKDNRQHHHLLFTSPQSKSEMTWEGPLDDQDHPKMVLGRLWHLHNEEATPYLIR